MFPRSKVICEGPLKKFTWPVCVPARADKGVTESVVVPYRKLAILEVLAGWLEVKGVTDPAVVPLQRVQSWRI